MPAFCRPDPCRLARGEHQQQPDVRKQLPELARVYPAGFRAGVKPVAGIQTITIPDPDDKF